MREIFGLFAVVVLVGSLNAGAASAETNIEDPVIFDGVRVSAAEFNILRLRHAGRTTLNYVFLRNDPALYVFSSTADLYRFIAENTPQRPARRSSGSKSARPLLSHGCSFHNDPVYSKFYSATFCGGAILWMQSGGAFPDFGALGFDNVTSSITCSTDFNTSWCTMWENPNYGGEALWTQQGVVRDTLGVWDNRGSSAIIYGFQ